MRDDDTPTIASGQSGEAPAQAVRRGSVWDDEPAYVGGEEEMGHDDDTKVIGGPPPSFAWLVVMNGPRAGRILTLDAEGTTIGRDARSQIILDDNSVTAFHAKLRMEEDEEGDERFSIQDLATTNGTFVNGEAILKQFLNDGDAVRIGETELVFKKV
jgi:hypothetical protein